MDHRVESIANQTLHRLVDSPHHLLVLGHSPAGHSLFLLVALLPPLPLLLVSTQWTTDTADFSLNLPHHVLQLVHRAPDDVPVGVGHLLVHLQVPHQAVLDQLQQALGVQLLRLEVLPNPSQDVELLLEAILSARQRLLQQVQLHRLDRPLVDLRQAVSVEVDPRRLAD